MGLQRKHLNRKTLDRDYAYYANRRYGFDRAICTLIVLRPRTR